MGPCESLACETSVVIATTLYLTLTWYFFPSLPPSLNSIFSAPLSAGVVNVFSGVMKSATSVLLKIDEVGPMDSSGDMAYERSHYTFYDKDGNVFDHGK